MLRIELLQRYARRLYIKHKKAKVCVFVEMDGRLYSFQSTPDWPVTREEIANKLAQRGPSQDLEGASSQLFDSVPDDDYHRSQVSLARFQGKIDVMKGETPWLDDTSLLDFATVCRTIRALYLYGY